MLCVVTEMALKGLSRSSTMTWFNKSYMTSC